jgi:glutamate/tyrosine decarboxylase-like PLP-dependent enzyme
VPTPFDDLPDPELIDVRDPGARDALQRFGDDVWREALGWLYGNALVRANAPGRYAETRSAFFGDTDGPGAAPIDGRTATEVLREFRERIAPYTSNGQHPGSYSYFTPPPLPMAVAGEVLAAWTNQGIDLWLAGMAGPFVEEEVIHWLTDLVGYGEGSWGVLVSGGVMANVMGLTLARDVHLARVLGLTDPPRGSALEAARVYASDQAHFSIARGLDLLGFPPQTLHLIPSDEGFRLHAEPVAAAIAEDRAAGLTPFCIAPVVGSTNTGSIDDVPALSDLAEREGLWIHVDAAYGGAARLSPALAGRAPGLERADSLTIDPHKWFFQPYDIGALLVKRLEDLRHTFHREPEYYRVGDPRDEPLNWYQFSLEGTRRFRALKLWLSWKHLGTRGFAALIDHTVDLATHFAGRCLEAGFEVIEPELSVVCVRHVPSGLDGAAVDAHQRRLQRALEVSGDGWVSTTTLRGRTWLRAGIVNYLSRPEDADRVVEILRRAADED